MTTSTEPRVTFTITTAIPLAQLDAHPDNPRTSLGDLRELTASIETVGLLQPLVVVPTAATASKPKGIDKGDRYVIVAGHRRAAAAAKAGLTEVDCAIRPDLTPESATVHAAMLIENLQRVDLDPLEEARGLSKLVELGQSQTQIAKAIGRSQPHVSKRLQLLKLPAKVHKALAKGPDDGGITLNDALALAAVADEPALLEASLRIAGEYSGGRALRNVDNAIDRARAAAEAVTRADENRAKLEKRGVRVIDVEAELGRYPYEHQVHTYESSRMPALKVHEKLDCHVAGIGHNGEIVYYCLKPKTHRGESTEAKKEKAARAELKLLKEAATNRREYIGELLTRRLPDQAVHQLLVRHAVAGGVYGSDAGSLAARWLGAADTGYGAGRALERWAADDPKKAEQIGIACALAGMEIRDMGTGMHDRWNERSLAHVDWLTGQGYQLTEIEEARLQAVRKAIAKERRPEPQTAGQTALVLIPGTCRVCGCTDAEACVDDLDQACSWAEPDLCSACVGSLVEAIG